MHEKSWDKKPSLPQLKVSDPMNFDGEDPAKMDNYLNGSPDKGMWWLMGKVDTGYRASTPYRNSMDARRAQIRSSKGKPRYY